MVGLRAEDEWWEAWGEVELDDDGGGVEDAAEGGMMTGTDAWRVLIQSKEER